MKLGIFGLPQTGKKTLFGLLTGAAASSPDAQKAVTGVAEIFDPRFDRLAAMYNPKKRTRARINIDLLPKLEPDSAVEGDIFKNIADTDALCHVVRAFRDEAVYHVSGSVNPARDIERISSELILHDMLFVEKRLERLAAGKKKQGAELAKKEEDLLLRFKERLDANRPLRGEPVSDEETKLIASYPFVTMKPVLIVLNVADGDAGARAMLDELSAKYGQEGVALMQISARLELEIAALETPEERAEFMAEAGIVEPAVNLLSRLCMEALGLISYFTVGEDEVRQWQVRRGALAPEAGGVIHTDIARGFIRAEVIKYDDLISLGGEDAVKKAGKLGVMGKDYEVRDGDIMNFRFNV
ncbi:MAG: redox-regulated ATPase YchF [Spirochaetes bacterium]|nr:MAG: redox-regulated ATPase YchF [Spirochaetota bacterium]